MKTLSIAICFYCMLCAVSCNRTPGDKGIVLTVHRHASDGAYVHDSYILTSQGESTLAAVLVRKPEHVDAAIALAPTADIRLDGQLYAIEEDQIIRMAADTDIWTEKGIQNRLIRNSIRKETEPNKTIEGSP